MDHLGPRQQYSYCRFRGKRGPGLTETGSPTLLCGRLDWVYQEEIYGRGEFRGYWWSPHSTRVAFLELDVSGVSEHTLPSFESEAGEGVTYRYPRAGTLNPRARLGVVKIVEAAEATETAPGAVSWVDLPETGDDRFLIVNVAWSPNGRVLSFQTQNREQTWLELFVVDPDSGNARSVLRETSKAWVRAPGPPHWLDDGAFVWTSDRTGWSHLYLHAPGGQLVRPVTSGEWDVREVHGIDNRTVYFSAAERSAVSVHTYRVRLDGSGFERLTTAEGTHQSLFSPGLGHFIDTWSSVNSPAEVRLHSADGVEIRRLEGSTAPDRDRYDLGRTEYLQVPARDGYLLEAMMIKPPDFDPNRKYPVLCHVYGGPMTPLVRNAWEAHFHVASHAGGARRYCLGDRQSNGQRQGRRIGVSGLSQLRILRASGPGRRYPVAGKSAIHRSGAHRHLGMEFRRLPDRLRHDSQQAVSPGYRRCSGHRLGVIRHDLYRALHADSGA